MSASTSYVQTQPTLSRFTLRGFLDLPRRICSPPAAVGKVRSFGLTPIFDIKLDDVLDRKHLPPLSLKDFEEWLLYVEQCAENLYFILWLREYTIKYERWVAKVRAREAKAKRAPGSYRVEWSTSVLTSPALSHFYARAHDTFLVPGAPYELSLPPALLTPLGGCAAYPDPAIFTPVRQHVETALRGSLQRCVRAAYSNVGTYRAACGIAAGTFILLAGTVPPLVVNFVKGQTRWERLVILPGLFLGLTILIASLRGVCMMIYIFGDFRQLRKFELVRPAPSGNKFPNELDPNSPTVSNPTHPVRALTAPPKIAIRIPGRTPTLCYSNTESGTESGFYSSYTETNAHTISISSAKSRAYASSLSPEDFELEMRSVPACGSTDSDDEGSIDDAGSISEHGIYISRAMPPTEVSAEEDPAVVNAALALIARAGPGPVTLPLSLSGPSTSSVPPPTVPVASPPLPAQTPTASFIPSYPYLDSESSCKESRRSRSVDITVRDLEAGPAIPPRALGTFDFDALPPPRPRERERSADLYYDTTSAADADEKGPGFDIDPISPARMDDVAKLCEKGPDYENVRVQKRHPVASHILSVLRLLPAFSGRGAFNYGGYEYGHYGQGEKRAWRSRCKQEARVPAFGPVTRVLAPVVARAQWEIVMRAAGLAVLIGGMIAAVIVAVPEP